MNMRQICIGLLALVLVGATPSPSPTPAPAPIEVLSAAAAFFKAVGDGNSGLAFSLMTKYSQDELVKTVANDQHLTQDAVRAVIKTKPALLDSRFADIRTMITTGLWKDVTQTSCWVGILYGPNGALADCPPWHSVETEPLKLRYEDGAWRVAWIETLFGS
jgi:hypothetical protein